MRKTANTQPSRRFPGDFARPHSRIERALATTALACVIGGFLPALAHAQEESQPRNGKLTVPPPTDGNDTLVVRVQVTQPYIDKVATRVTYDGMDRVFGIEWKTRKTRGKLRVPDAVVIDAMVVSDILDDTNAGISAPARYTPVTTPRLFPYLIAVRDKWGQNFNAMAHASAKIAAISLVATMRPVTSPLTVRAATTPRPSPAAGKPTLPPAKAVKTAPSAKNAPTTATTTNSPAKAAPTAVVPPLPKPSGIWSLPIFKRGRALEKARGTNLPSNYPVIDRFNHGTATSIKSLDVGAKSYQSPRALTSKVRRYINKVAKFKGKRWAGRHIRENQIKSRTLELVVPHTGTPAQQEALLQLIQYGRSVDVQVSIIVYP